MSNQNQIKEQLNKIQKELDALTEVVNAMQSSGVVTAKSGEIPLSPKRTKSNETAVNEEDSNGRSDTNTQEKNTKREDKKAATEDSEGIEGVYEGTHMVTPSGEKIEVPENYAAKTKLVFGDTLKAFDGENGRKMFKHISKVPKKSLDGVLHNKEGKWSFVTDSGVYQVLTNAAEYRKAKDGDEATALLPEDTASCKFATLDKVVSSSVQNEKKEAEKNALGGSNEDTSLKSKKKKSDE